MASSVVLKGRLGFSVGEGCDVLMERRRVLEKFPLGMSHSAVGQEFKVKESVIRYI